MILFVRASGIPFSCDIGRKKSFGERDGCDWRRQLSALGNKRGGKGGRDRRLATCNGQRCSYMVCSFLHDNAKAQAGIGILRKFAHTPRLANDLRTLGHVDHPSRFFIRLQGMKAISSETNLAPSAAFGGGRGKARSELYNFVQTERQLFQSATQSVKQGKKGRRKGPGRAPLTCSTAGSRVHPG